MKDYAVRVLFALTVLVWGAFAHATNGHGEDEHEGCHGNCPTTTVAPPAGPQTVTAETGDIVSTSTSGSESASTSSSTAEGGAADAQAVAVGGDSHAEAGDSAASSHASNGGNSLSITDNYKYKEAASTPATVAGNTTASCKSFIGISGMGISGGGGVGFPITDGDCKFMTLAAGAFMQGNPRLGWELYCRAPTVKKEIGFDNCLAFSTN